MGSIPALAIAVLRTLEICFPGVLVIPEIENAIEQ